MGIAAASDHLARFEAVKISPKTAGKIFKITICQMAIKELQNRADDVKGAKNCEIEQQLEKELGEWERFV